MTSAMPIMKIRYIGKWNPPTDRRFLEHGGRSDVQVVPAPDIKSRLLKQVGEAHRQQHLPQRIETQPSQEYTLHQQPHHGDASAATGRASSQEPVVQITVSAT